MREREEELTHKKKEMRTLRYEKKKKKNELYTYIDRSITYNSLKHDFIQRHETVRTK